MYRSHYWLGTVQIDCLLERDFSCLDQPCTNFLLTERDGHTGEYWPEVVAMPIFPRTVQAS